MQREVEIPREQGKSGGCALVSLGMEGFEAFSSLSEEDPGANYFPLLLVPQCTGLHLKCKL